MAPIIYGHLIQWLRTLSNRRLILYEQDSTNNSNYRKECLLECSKALLNEPLPKLCVKKQFSKNANNYLNCNIKTHNNTWKSLQY